MKTAIFGLGRVGLPMALYLASKKYQVIGFDIDEKRLSDLKSGKFPFKEKGGQELLTKHLNKGFALTNRPKLAIESSKYIILTVGTPVNTYMNPNFKQVFSAIDQICKYIKKDQTILLRSTLAPSTTEKIEERLEKKTKLKIGKDIFVAYVPERTAEGSTIEEMPYIPQIIGANQKKSQKKASVFFKKISPSVLLSDSRSAEIAKLICNMYRYVNFALGNELMMLSDKQDRNVYEIIRLANTDYKRGGVSYPGFSAGPCLFKDGFFLINGAPYTELISTSWSINERIPNYLIDQLSSKTKISGKKAAVLGLAFKKNSDDPRDSLSYKVVKVLENERAEVVASDPYIESPKLADSLKNAKIVVVATNHDRYKKLGLSKIVKMTAQKSIFLIDIWNMFGTNKIVSKINA